MAVPRATIAATVALVAAVAGGCTPSTVPDGTLSCSQVGRTIECPEGTTCGIGDSSDELRCYQNARAPDELDAAMRDAANPDAAMLDASVLDADTSDARAHDADPPEPEDGGAPPDGWPPCEGSRRYIPVARSTDDVVGGYCVQRRADRMIAECHATPEDCTCLEGHRLPEEWQCVLRPSVLRCFRYRKCRTGDEERLIGCYDGDDRCGERYRGVIACEAVPLSPEGEACLPPEALPPAPSGSRAIERPGWGCCWQ